MAPNAGVSLLSRLDGTGSETEGSAGAATKRVSDSQNKRLGEVKCHLSKGYTQEGYDLDLVYLTDRLIIMGYPAHGFEAVYRNDRNQVKKFLQARHGDHFHVFNFCPRFENSYDARFFDDRVSRFPFPDHHPPPFSLIPIFVDALMRYFEENPKNVAVIHCKAGKGRSGTLTCAYLLASGISASATTQMNQKALEAANNTDVAETKPSQKEVLSIADQLASVYELHTKQRMKASATGKRGVSIPSQRRFLSYYSRVLDQNDPRILEISMPRPRLWLTRIEIRTTKSSLQNFSVVVSTYADGIRQTLVEQENDLYNRAESSAVHVDDDRPMFRTLGYLKNTKSLRRQNCKTLRPSNSDLLVDADAELRIKVLWASHLAVLPSVVSLGYCWIIPSFEAHGHANFAVTLPRSEIDFYKAFSHIESITAYFESAL